ncbi:MAG TPA: orotate phosphoribosyltransferase [Pseudogracilibacillus sp.]|nr:orotate phosphoribosyltransferase [Pseudogracilibacillus sp.]
MEYSTEIAEDLLAIEAVQIKTKQEEYFTWTSGIKSPIYCDNRLTMSYPNVRKKIVRAFIEKMQQLPNKPDVIVGCATAGIPHAAWLAEALDVPMAYVRSKPKGHGKGNQIEGQIFPGQKVLVIEDLISTGGSSIEAAEVLLEAGAEVLSVFAIFTYGLPKAEDAFQKAAVSFTTITGYDTLLSVLKNKNQINDREIQELLQWRDHL